MGIRSPNVRTCIMRFDGDVNEAAFGDGYVVLVFAILLENWL